MRDLTGYLGKRLFLEWCGFAGIFSLTLALYFFTQSDSYDQTSVRVQLMRAAATTPDGTRRPSNTSHSDPTHPQPCSNSVRQRHLETQCENWKTLRHIRFQDPGTYWALLTDDVHKVLYCIVPKAGCTSVQTMIINSTGRLHDPDEMAVHDPAILSKLDFKYLHEYPFEEIIWRLEHYSKFLVVRHPFERLYSAYKDKILNVPYFKQRFGGVIKKYYPSHDPEDNSKPLSLEEFLTLIANEYDTGYKDRHWATIDEICHPCDVKFDYIAKLETLEHDLTNILPLFPAKDGSIPKGIPTLHTETHRQSRYEDKFRAIPGEIMRRIYSLYQFDFQLFGYSWSNYTAGSCAVQDGRDTCC